MSDEMIEAPPGNRLGPERSFETARRVLTINAVRERVYVDDGPDWYPGEMGGAVMQSHAWDELSPLGQILVLDDAIAALTEMRGLAKMRMDAVIKSVTDASRDEGK